MKYQTTYALRSNMLHHIFAIQNPLHCKQNVKFFVSSVASFEAVLITENKMVSHFLEVRP